MVLVKNAKEILDITEEDKKVTYTLVRNSYNVKAIKFHPDKKNRAAEKDPNLKERLNKEFGKLNEARKILEDHFNLSITDNAMAVIDEGSQVNQETVNISNVGGINLDAAMLDLQIKRDGNGVPLPMIHQDVDLGMKVMGFLPIIINVTPVSLPALLGFADDMPTGDDGATMELGFNTMLSRDPMDVLA